MEKKKFIKPSVKMLNLDHTTCILAASISSYSEKIPLGKAPTTFLDYTNDWR